MTRPNPHEYSAAIQHAHETRRRAWPDPQSLIGTLPASGQEPSKVAAYGQARWDMVEIVEDAVQTLPMMDTVEGLDALTHEICSRIGDEATKMLAVLRGEHDLE